MPTKRSAEEIVRAKWPDAYECGLGGIWSSRKWEGKYLGKNWRVAAARIKASEVKKK